MYCAPVLSETPNYNTLIQHTSRTNYRILKPDMSWRDKAGPEVEQVINLFPMYFTITVGDDHVSPSSPLV